MQKKLISICLSIFIILFFSISFYTQSPILDDSTLEQAEEAGTYPVEVSYVSENGESIKKTIYITIYFPKTEKNDVFNEAIDATDVFLNEKSFKELTDNELIQLANAHA